MKCLISSLLNIKIGSAFPWVWVPFSPLVCAPWELCPAPIKPGQGPHCSQWVLSHRPQAQKKKKTRGLFGKVPFHAELSWNEKKICGSWSKVLGSSSLWQNTISCQQHPSLPIGIFCVAETDLKRSPSGFPLGVNVIYTISSRRSAGWM